MVHNEIGRRILTRLAVELNEVALVEVPPRQEGMTMVQILGPKKEAPSRVTKPKRTPKAEGASQASKPAKTAQPVVAVGDKTESPE